jgi:pSer/pThr/pTyr-binding forkhead associated (FHA) protein
MFPCRVEYQLEILKSGHMIRTLDLTKYCRRSDKGWISFGRVPDNDWEVQHPSTSRYHVVVQCSGDDGVFLYDMESTHGTFLNKSQIPEKQYVQFRVGDQMRIGNSDRVYVLNGPQDLMPAEGMSRAEKQQAEVLEAYRRNKKAEEEKAKEQMAIAMSRGEGMSSDKVQAALYSGNFDWRGYAREKGLTDKQQKVADKIRKKQNRIEHVQRENDRIMAKQKQDHGSLLDEGLTVGQANTLAKNEREIGQLMEEIEDLEDQIIDSIQDSIDSALGSKTKISAKHARNDGSDEDLESDDDDMVFDRTKTRKRKYRKSSKSLDASRKALDARDILKEIHTLETERDTLTRELDREDARETRGETSTETAEDSLDAYIESVKGDAHATRIHERRKRLGDINAELGMLQKMLHVADPEGFLTTSFSKKSNHGA